MANWISFGILFSANLFMSGAFAAPEKIVGQLGLVDGQVYVDSKPVQKNASVHQGSVIETKKGHATLLLGKGSVFNLGPDSKMVVNQYAEKTTDTAEGAELDLKFGRTRALILNEGTEKKDIKIKARAATMGVRGTEIYIDAPKEAGKPVQFFTLEGKADVTAHPGAPIVAVPQNHGVSASGIAPSANSKAGSAASSKGNNATVSTMSMNDIKADLKSSGLESAPLQLAQAGAPGAANTAPGSLSGSIGLSSLPPIQFDPIRDRSSNPLSLKPHFCNAAKGVCN